MVKVRLTMNGVITTTNNKFNSPTTLINARIDCPRHPLLSRFINKFDIISTEFVTPTIEGVSAKSVVEYDLPELDTLPSRNGFLYWNHYNIVITSGEDQIRSEIKSITVEAV